jgi:hypothetical protein
MYEYVCEVLEVLDPSHIGSVAVRLLIAPETPNF